MNILMFVIYEVCLRVCAQSLFATNASYYLTLSANILTKHLSKYVNITSSKTTSTKKSSIVDVSNEEIDQKKANTFTDYALVIRKQSIKSAPLMITLYQNLFKAISMQMSNFVHANSKIEIDQILNQVYVFLCSRSSSSSSSSDFYTRHILSKFIFSNCFNGSHQSTTPTPTPTKSPLSSANNLQNMSQSNATYLQFAFKYLIYFEANTTNESTDAFVLTQLKTMSFLNENIDTFLFSEKKFENSTANALTLILIWCLTSKSKKIRCQAASLLEKINAEFANNVSIKNLYLTKLIPNL
jgi:hypothetical protein